VRTYPRNSPQAAARIVALTLLADGHVCNTELHVLEQLNAEDTLGLGKSELQGVLHDLCEDMLASAEQSWSGTCQISPETLAQLMDEVDDPRLRKQVMRMCLDVANADHQVTKGETIVLSAAIDRWNRVTGVSNLSA